LGLGTPEVRRWVQAGHIGASDDDDEGNGRDSEDEDTKRIERKKVGFAEEPESDVLIEKIEVVQDDHNHRNSEDRDSLEEPTIRMTVQISPRRPTNVSNQDQPWPSAGSPYHLLSNTLLSSAGAEVKGYQPLASPAHDLLHTLIRDALYDFRRETKAEIIGLHLDIVKMGRGWRKEMREALDKWGDELQGLKEENDRLRQENEMLRRGY